MDLDPRSVVVPVASRRNAKLAALYWDYVVPVYCDDIPQPLIPPAFGDWKPTTATDLLRRMQKAKGSERLTVSVPDGFGGVSQVPLVDKSGQPDLDALERVSQSVFVHRPEGEKVLRDRLVNAGLERSPVLLSALPLASQQLAGTGTEVTAVLAGLPIVDVSKVSWEQIMDFRQDAESRRKLRILRLHLANEFIGKTHEQIAAGLELGIEECRQTAKKHGFDLRVSSLQAICDAKDTVQALGLWALVGAVVGGSVAAAVTGASAGVMLELAKLTVTVAKGANDLKEFRKHHPYSYIIDAKSKLGG